LNACVTVTGYLASDEAFTDCIAACDVALNLRWPTAREVSGPWLRCLAAGKPTVIVDLAHLTAVPTIDPRTWRPHGVASLGPLDDALVSTPCAVAIDILDEDHSLRLAMRRLGTDEVLRAALGRAARARWDEQHSIAAMAADYRTLIADAMERPAPAIALPPHLVDDGSRTLARLLEPFGLASPLEPSRPSPTSLT
jgi:hypothetical protein